MQISSTNVESPDFSKRASSSNSSNSQNNLGTITANASGWEVAAGISEPEIEIDLDDIEETLNSPSATQDLEPEIMDILTQLDNLGIELTESEINSLAENLRDNEEILSNIEENIFILEEWIKECSVSDRTYSVNDISNIEINTNGLDENKIIYVPDPNDNTKYFQMTIKEFVGYVSANGDNRIYNECLTERDDGTLVFDYNKAKNMLNVVDGTTDAIDRNMYTNLAKDFSDYIAKMEQLSNSYILKIMCEDNINNVIYNYIQNSDKFFEVLGESGIINPTPEALDILNEINADSNIINNIDCLTEDQKRMIIYLYNEGGNNTVRQYLNEQNINNQVYEVLGAREAEEFLETLPKDSNGNIDVDTVTTILTSIEGLEDGVGNYIEGLENLAKFATGADGEESINSYKQLYILKALQESKWLTGTYNVSTSIGNMAIPLASSAVLGTLGLSSGIYTLIPNSIFFSSNLGNSYNSGKLSGLTDSQAREYAFLSAASEFTTQMFLGGIPGLSYLYSSNSFIKNILSEGFEEAFQEVFDTTLMSAMKGDKIDLSNLTNDALTAGFYGIIVAGILGGAQSSFRVIIGGQELTITQDDIETIENEVENGTSLEDALKALEEETINDPDARNSEIAITSEIASIMEEYNCTQEIAAIIQEKNCSLKMAEIIYGFKNPKTNSNKLLEDYIKIIENESIQNLETFEKIMDKLINAKSETEVSESINTFIKEYTINYKGQDISVYDYLIKVGAIDPVTGNAIDPRNGIVTNKSYGQFIKDVATSLLAEEDKKNVSKIAESCAALLANFEWVNITSNFESISKMAEAYGLNTSLIKVEDNNGTPIPVLDEEAFSQYERKLSNVEVRILYKYNEELLAKQIANMKESGKYTQEQIARFAQESRTLTRKISQDTMINPIGGARTGTNWLTSTFEGTVIKNAKNPLKEISGARDEMGNIVSTVIKSYPTVDEAINDMMKENKYKTKYDALIAYISEKSQGKSFDNVNQETINEILKKIYTEMEKSPLGRTILTGAYEETIQSATRSNPNVDITLGVL